MTTQATPLATRTLGTDPARTRTRTVSTITLGAMLMGTRGGESESLLGWLKSRGVGAEMTIATKLCGRPDAPSNALSLDVEVQSAARIREAAKESLERLVGVSNHRAWAVKRRAASRRSAACRRTTCGASSVAQLDKTLAAATLEVSAEQRARLDAAGTE